MSAAPDDAGRVRQTWLVVLDDDECDELLARATIGRLAVIVDGRPEIFPVSYRYDIDGRSVVFPTNDRTKLRAALGWPYVAFEIDGHTDHEGWSVSLVGRAREVDPPHPVDPIAGGPLLWRGGRDIHWVGIVADKISGRRISAPR